MASAVHLHAAKIATKTKGLARATLVTCGHHIAGMGIEGIGGFPINEVAHRGYRGPCLGDCRGQGSRRCDLHRGRTAYSLHMG